MLQRYATLGRYMASHKQAQLEVQDGECAICHGDLTMRSARLDHCHETDIVRGALCNSCNIALGMFEDSVGLLEQAIEYLKEWQARIESREGQILQDESDADRCPTCGEFHFGYGRLISHEAWLARF